MQLWFCVTTSSIRYSCNATHWVDKILYRLGDNVRLVIIAFRPMFDQPCFPTTLELSDYCSYWMEI